MDVAIDIEMQEEVGLRAIDGKRLTEVYLERGCVSSHTA